MRAGLRTAQGLDELDGPYPSLDRCPDDVDAVALAGIAAVVTGRSWHQSPLAVQAAGPQPNMEDAGDGRCTSSRRRSPRSRWSAGS